MAGASDYIISDGEKNQVNVSSQPDALVGTAAQNKQAFDNYPDLIKTRFNSLCTYIDSNQSSEIAAQVKVLYATLGWVQD